ncbi:hypothetical protein Mgra_00006291 [Meloidogyne graminicola]|uniref:Uncharacterized protein n=1 Tax=Meloidogyne graminicola TaxID=189291 RepID=A0A8S9ZM15_9BILA|nr:hypothetical protein Mgra_00006291 [Meloidogyne graminicola]
MFSFILMFFTYLIAGISSFVIFFYGIYYGIYKPTKLIIRLIYSFCYYGIIVDGIYFIFSLYLNNVTTENCLNNNQDCKEEANNNKNITTNEFYFNIFF